MVGKVVQSKALYNRSLHVIPLQPFSLTEARQYIGERRSPREAMDAYLMLGGIPEYLKYITDKSSVTTSLFYHSFLPGSFLVQR